MSESFNVWSYATTFFKDCIAVLTGPKEFFEQTALTRARADDYAVSFAVISLLLFGCSIVVWIKSLAWGLEFVPLIMMLVWLAIYSVSFWFVSAFCWRIVGDSAPIESYIVIGAYITGGLFMIVSAAILLLLFPMHELFSAALAEGATEVYVDFRDLSGIERVYGVWTFFVMMSGVVGGLVFFTQAWGGYRQINQATQETSKKAMMLTTIVHGVVTGFVSSFVSKIEAFFS